MTLPVRKDKLEFVDFTSETTEDKRSGTTILKC